MIAYFDSGPIMSAFQTMNAKQEGIHTTVRKLYETEYEEGTMTLNAIAEELNISIPVLYDILRILNLPVL